MHKMSKRRVQQQNKNKQMKKKISEQRNELENKIMSQNGYRVITVVHMGDKIELDVKFDFNTVIKEFTLENLNFNEVSFVARTSDLLIITCNNCVNINYDLIDTLQNFLPATIVLFEHNNDKIISKTLGKILGDVKVVKKVLLKNVIKTFEFETSKICKNRPYMVVKNKEVIGDKMILEGFMKRGLASNKIIINGRIEALIEQVVVGENVYEGNELNVAESAEEYLRTNSEINEEMDEEVEISSEEEFEDDEEVNYVDLIEMYKDYRGIKDIKTCQFALTDDVIQTNNGKLNFYRNFGNLENKVLKRDKLISNYTTVKIVINRIIEDENIILFNLYEHELENTVMNYTYAGEIENDEIVVDNGIRVFNTKYAISKDKAQNAFKVENNEKCHAGVISFLAPVTFFSKTAVIYKNNSIKKGITIFDGVSEPRVFIEEIQLQGTPLKLFKHHMTIKGMFCNEEQVKYFKNIQLTAKNGNKGRIIKSLGTKGLFKATFNDPVRHGELVTMHLYRRINYGDLFK